MPDAYLICRCMLVGCIGVLTEQIDGNLLIVDVACVAAMEELKLLTQEVNIPPTILLFPVMVLI